MHKMGHAERYLHGFVQIQMESKEHGTAGLLPHYKQLSDGDRIAGEPVAPLRRSGAKQKANS